MRWTVGARWEEGDRGVGGRKRRGRWRVGGNGGGVEGRGKGGR